MSPKPAQTRNGRSGELENEPTVNKINENIPHVLEIMTSSALNIFDYLLNDHDFPIHMPSTLFCLLLLSITNFFPP